MPNEIDDMNVDDFKVKCQEAQAWCEKNRQRILNDYHAGSFIAKYVLESHKTLTQIPHKATWRLFIMVVDDLRSIYKM